MEEEKKQVASVKCPNSECGKSFKYQLPKKPGKYKLTCPDCKREFYVQFNPVDVKMDQPKDNAAVVECPYGCGQKFKYEPKSDGMHEVACPNKDCGHAIRIKVKDGQVVSVERKFTITIDEMKRLSKARLAIVRFYGLLGSIGKKVFPLQLGKNTVGRADADSPSTISIKGDQYMSRCSIEIEVIQQGSGGYLYKMTVLNATNPVLHNRQPLMVGETVYLNYGDSIRLGHTTFNFEKV